MQMVSKDPAKDVDKLRASLQAAEEAAERKRLKLRDMLIASELAENSEYKRMERSRKERKRHLHRLRLAISRNRFSIERTEEKLANKKEKLMKQEADETAWAQDVEEMERRMQEIRNGLARDVELPE